MNPLKFIWMNRTRLLASFLFRIAIPWLLRVGSSKMQSNDTQRTREKCSPLYITYRYGEYISWALNCLLILTMWPILFLLLKISCLLDNLDGRNFYKNMILLSSTSRGRHNQVANALSHRYAMEFVVTLSQVEADLQSCIKEVTKVDSHYNNLVQDVQEGVICK